MAKRLAEPKRREALELLAAGTPVHETARLTGLARNTVRSLARSLVAPAGRKDPTVAAFIRGCAAADSPRAYFELKENLAFNREQPGQVQLSALRYIHELAGVTPKIASTASGHAPVNVRAEQVQFLLNVERELENERRE